MKPGLNNAAGMKLRISICLLEINSSEEVKMVIFFVRKGLANDNTLIWSPNDLHVGSSGI